MKLLRLAIAFLGLLEVYLSDSYVWSVSSLIIVLLSFGVLRFNFYTYLNRINFPRLANFGLSLYLIFGFHISFFVFQQKLLLYDKSIEDLSLLGFLFLSLLFLVIGELFGVVSNFRLTSTKFKNHSLFEVISWFLIMGFFFLLNKGLVGYTGVDDTVYSGSTGFLVITITTLVHISFLFRLQIIFREGKKSITTLAWILFYFFLGLIGGMKEYLLVGMFWLVAMYLFYGNVLSNRTKVFGIFSILLIYPFVNNFRNAINNDIESSRISSLLSIDLNHGEKNILTEGLVSYMDRINLLSYGAYAYEYKDNWTTYKNLNRYPFIIWSSVVPRAVIGSKPTSTNGVELYHVLTGTRFSSVTPLTVGWLIFEGSVFTFLIGALVYYVFLFIASRIVNKKGVVLALLLIPMVIKPEADIYFKVNAMSQAIVVFLAYEQLLNWKR